MDNWLKIIQQRLAAWLALPCHCILCLQPSKAKYALCEGCEKYLPWLQMPCVLCALPLKHPNIRCPSCLLQPPPFERLAALFDYAWPVDAFVSQYKYGGQLHFATMLGNLMATHLKLIHPIDYIIAMPLHRARQQQRGFNQTGELAKVIAKRLTMPLLTSACHRIIATPAQSSLSATTRARNISASAFKVAPTLQGKQVLVIEDVVTTGTTVKAFSQALKQAGVSSVQIWASCRTGHK